MPLVRHTGFVVHNNTKQSVDQVANNTLRVVNNGSTTVRFHVNFSLPSGWEYLGNPEKDIELAGNDSIFLPVRLIVNRDSKGGTSYIVTAWLSSEKGVQFSSQNWYVTIPIHSEWNALIPVKQQYFITGNDSSGFRVRFEIWEMPMNNFAFPLFRSSIGSITIE
ncbi:MAG: hypothetical protein IPI10_19335 [Bacteroidetes bacterium]|nr:hypothetical protein [Bacteroidota bacterium]